VGGCYVSVANKQKPLNGAIFFNTLGDPTMAPAKLPLGLNMKIPAQNFSFGGSADVCCSAEEFFFILKIISLKMKVSS